MRKAKRKTSMILYVPFWGLIIAMFTGLIITQASRYNAYRRELLRVNEDLKQEQKVYDDLQDQIVYYESDAYIEQLARDQLGYVRPDEIVIVNDAD